MYIKLFAVSRKFTSVFFQDNDYIRIGFYEKEIKKKLDKKCKFYQ